MNNTLPKTYEPKNVEDKLSKLWQEKGLFKAQIDEHKKPYTIVIPPPNITGALHMGHGLNDTLQDVLVRYHRMKGDCVNWVAGSDHGGIATQNVIERKLKEQHLTRHDLGREKFVSVVWDWYKDCGNAIYNQFEKMGWALDQSNIRFTMDETRAKAVYACFKNWWDKGYIYRGKRLINWCVRCSTALSDIEVEHSEHNGKLWHLLYKGENGNDIVIATTRPETIYADAAIAVNPKDERYANMIGKKVKIPLTDRYIPIIADEAVEKDFGTGALKITPAHDATDYEVGKRHNLESIIVIDSTGKMINTPSKYLGMDRDVCRKETVKDLDSAGLLVKEENYKNAVSTCYRCNQPIEPYLSEQWFVRMDKLSDKALEAVEKEEVKFYPSNWKAPMVNWLKNMQDWCISRQIWWGHRIPVWYCPECSKNGLTFAKDKQGNEYLSKVSFADGAEPIVSYEQPICPKCGCKHTLQDPDVLDTWFSSSLWPISVFGWPEQTKELNYFYPTSILVTGYEIIYLWVARMIMTGLDFTGKVPFSQVLLNGIVRDKSGLKMSKSKGNVVDPLDMTSKYGADAVRFSLISQAITGKDIPYGEENIIGARNFCNKIYNASRFILMNIAEGTKITPLKTDYENLEDKWIISRYNGAIKRATKALESYDMSVVADTLYHFLWDDFCDWYIELAKPRLTAKDNSEVSSILVNILFGTLKALHPLMPYITEEIAISLKPYFADTKEFLLQETYPICDDKYINTKAETDMSLVQGVISAIRTIRSQFNVPPSEKIKVLLAPKTEQEKLLLDAQNSFIKLLAKVDSLEISADVKKPSQSATAVFADTTIYVPLKGLIDFDKEHARLEKELNIVINGIKNRTRMLENKNFLERAPKAQVDNAKSELLQMTAKKAEIETAIKDLA